MDTGGKIRSYNILRQLAARHQTTLLSYYHGAADPEYNAAISTQFPGAVGVGTGGEASGKSTLVDYLRRSFAAAPYAISKFSSPRVASLIAQWTREGRFDVVVCDFLAPLSISRRRCRPQLRFSNTTWNPHCGAAKRPIREI